MCACGGYYGGEAVSKEEKAVKLISALAIPVMIFGIILFGLIKRVNVYDCFVEGAKDGIQSLFGIIAPLVGLMVAISMLRASGVIEMLGKVLSPLTSRIGMPDAVLPLAMLRPVSGSASLAIVNDIFSNYGADSAAGKIASVMMGSTETTFYTLAVYFGAVGVKNTRHALKAALIADFTGITVSVITARMFL